MYHNVCVCILICISIYISGFQCVFGFQWQNIASQDNQVTSKQHASLAALCLADPCPVDPLAYFIIVIIIVIIVVITMIIIVMMNMIIIVIISSNCTCTMPR